MSWHSVTRLICEEFTKGWSQRSRYTGASGSAQSLCVTETQK
jgi:hypothetical protein